MTKQAARKRTEYQPELFGHKVVMEADALVPTVSRLLANVDDNLVSLRISFRGEFDYLAIAKRVGDKGHMEVCFGSGSSWVGCLMGLEASLDNNKWRPDKFEAKGILKQGKK